MARKFLYVVVVLIALVIAGAVAYRLYGPQLLRFALVAEEDFAVDEAAAAKALGEGSAAVLAATADALEPVEQWDTEHVQAAMDGALLEGGLGLKRNKAYAPVRVAVTGSSISPPLPESMALLGKERVLLRLRAAAAR